MARQPACRLILGLGGYGLDKPVLWTGRGSQVSTILSLSTAASLPVEHASSGGNYAASTPRFVLAYFIFRFVR